jgi:hypothetical protein
MEVVEKNKKIRILCPIIFFSDNRDVYEIIRKNVAQPERSQMKIY